VDTWVALLRGVNVGTANRLAMADLRALLTDLGYADVRTLLNSGNAVFTAPEPPDPDALSATLAQRLGVRSPVVLLRVGELAAAVGEDPLGRAGEDDSRLLLVFCAEPPDPKRFVAEVAGGDLAVGARWLHIWCPDGVLASPHAPLTADRGAGTTVTSRNRRTAEKLLALAGEPG